MSVSTVTSLRRAAIIILAALTLNATVSPAQAAPQLSEGEQQVLATVASAQALPDRTVSHLIESLQPGDRTPSSKAKLTGEQVGWKLDNGNTVVALKLDDGGLNLSAIAFTFDKSSKLAATSEVLVTSARGQLSAKQWLNKYELGTDVAVSAPNTKALSTTVAAKSFHFSLKTFNSCLASAGVAWWVVAMVAAVCGLVGVPTAGVGFIACAVGTLGISSGVAGFCYAKATA